jgi:hypothetical protein
VSHEEEVPRIESGPRGRREEHRVRGDQLVSKVKELIHEGNVRRITIKNEEGKTLIEIPLTLGVMGAVLLPVWAGIGAIAALVTNCSIEVEREDKDGEVGREDKDGEEEEDAATE